MIPALMAAMFGAATILWVAGARMLDPREVGWVMHGDWQIHFLGWQFFRHEPWQLPPGAIRGFLEPIGTALGYTDSIPLVALILRPFSDWMPNPFQYLGLWFLVCFSLQGLFGALVVSTWTPRPVFQLIGGMLFVFFPTLVSRIAHPALCAHWLLLWGLWLYWRSAPLRADYGQHVALGSLAGLIHPYLAVMVLALLLALAVRRAFARAGSALSDALMPFALAASAVVSGWWASGLLGFGSTQDVTAESGRFSMNLLAIVNPGPRAFLLPGIKVVSLDQFGEGFQYFGAGVLVLCGVAVVVAVRRRVLARSSVPLLVVLGACAAYSLMPQISFGTRVLLDLTDQAGAYVSVFRSTGRFFWPVGYAALAAAIGISARELKPRVAGVVLSLALVVQLVDLHKWWLEMHDGSRTEAFFAWDMPLRSPEWDELLPRYRHMRLYFPEFCRGPVAGPTAAVAYLAGLHGLSINDGFAARIPLARQREACTVFGSDFTRGSLDDETAYLLTPALMADFQSRLGDAVSCRAIDGVGVCVSNRASPPGAAEKAPLS